MIFIQNKETGETRSFNNGEELSRFMFGLYIPNWTFFVGVPFDISGGEVDAFGQTVDSLAALLLNRLSQDDAEFEAHEKSVKASIARGACPVDKNGRVPGNRII